MMEGLIARIEKTDSKVWMFLLGLVVACIISYMLYARRRMAVQRALQEHKAKQALTKAKRAKDKGKAARHRAIGKAHRARAIDLNKTLKALDDQVQDAHARIDAARSIDELAKL